MNFNDFSQEQKVEYGNLMLEPLNSPLELKNWIMSYLGLDMPIGHIDPDSTSSPVEAMWEIYDAVKNNKGDVQSGFIMLSSRAGFKTLSASILETILMLHFKVTIAHMAAIKEQSYQSVAYINLFFTKIDPLLTAVGWENKSSNKNEIEYKTDKKESVYIKIVVCTMAGANCVDPGSLVFTEKRGQIRICELNPREKILTRNYIKGIDEFVVCKFLSITQKYARKLTLSDGRTITVSNDHPIFTDSGWISASKIQLGHKVIVNDQLKSDSSIHLEYKIARTLDQIMLGTLLGDGCLHKLPSGKIRYSVFHRERDIGYLKEIATELQKHGIYSKLYPTKGGYFLCTRTSPIFIDYYKLAYSGINNKKMVTEDWLSKLNLEGISYWIQDDGRGNPEKIGSSKEHCIELATCGFSHEENELISRYFMDKGYQASVNSVTNQTKKRYPLIKFSLEDSRNLSDKVQPFFVNSLRYKLLSSNNESRTRWETDTGSEIKVDYVDIGKMVWNKVPNSSKSRSLSRNIKNQLNVEVTKIELLGKIDLIDVNVESKHPTTESFYCNGILVHNSKHTNLFFIDEIDVISNPLAYQESKRIPTYASGRHPITVKLSTRKYAFGMMAKEIENAPITGDKILRWNVMDITERCPPERHKPEERREDRYVAKSLPLRQISMDDYYALPDVEKAKWEVVPMAFSGCKTCPLLPTCRTKLATVRDEKHKGGLYRPIIAVANEFKTTEPDMAEAQLMCWKPSSKGLVYPRFEANTHKGNLLTLDQAYESLMGDAKKGVNHMHLIETMKRLDIPFYAGVDWGFTHDFVIVIFAKMPNGEMWVVDCYAQAGLEISDILEIAKTYRDRYSPVKWYCDTAQPAFLKTFNKNGMKSPSFKKDVMSGIEALRSKIIDGAGRRLLKVLNIPVNEKVINAFKKHHFKLDQQGNPTLEPDDEPGIADPADAMRYVGQELFPVKGPQKPNSVLTGDDGQPIDPNTPEGRAKYEEMMEKAKKASIHENQMKGEIQRLINEDPSNMGKLTKKGGFFFSF